MSKRYIPLTANVFLLLIIVIVVFGAPSSIRVAGKICEISTSVKQFTIPFTASPIINYGSGFIIGTGVAATGTIPRQVVCSDPRQSPEVSQTGLSKAITSAYPMKSQLRIVSNKLAKLGHLKSNKAEVLPTEGGEKDSSIFATRIRRKFKGCGWSREKVGVEPGVLESIAIDIQTEYAPGLPPSGCRAFCRYQRLRYFFKRAGRAQIRTFLYRGL